MCAAASHCALHKTVTQLVVHRICYCSELLAPMPRALTAQTAHLPGVFSMRASGPAREFEIKLEIPAQTVGKVMRLPWLWELASGELNASQLQSCYYDTPEFALRERGVTLRVRRVGSTRVQTIKAAVNGAALPIERDEWEEEITGDEPVLKLAATPLAGLSRKKLQRRLQPCFEIHVDRSAFPIQSANSAIEVAIDRAHIVGQDAASFCEIELELKRGASSEMARIARRIASEVPAALSLKTKAERGYALHQGKAPQPFFGDAIKLDASTRVGESFQLIGWNCLRHFALNKDAIAIGDVQAVHQMRRGLQRLRAAISVFDHLVDGPETDAVKIELAWLTSELDPVCELDTFLEGTLISLKGGDGLVASISALCDETAMRRQVALEATKQAIASDRYRQLELRTALWLIAAEWSDKAALCCAEPSRRILTFATKVLTERANKLPRTLKRFANGSAARTRKLHRSLERLSDTMDFFANLFPKAHARRAKYEAILRALLGDVGRLNDFLVHDRLRDQFMKSWTLTDARTDTKTAEKAFALGLAIGQQAPDREARMVAIKRTRRRQADARPFWA
jgi:inorganic triphosphatase YgiF